MSLIFFQCLSFGDTYLHSLSWWEGLSFGNTETSNLLCMHVVTKILKLKNTWKEMLKCTLIWICIHLTVYFFLYIHINCVGRIYARIFTNDGAMWPRFSPRLPTSLSTLSKRKEYKTIVSWWMDLQEGWQPGASVLISSQLVTMQWQHFGFGQDH